MISQNAIKSAAATLRTVLARASKDADLTAIIDARDEVLNRYQPVFSPNHIPSLSEDELRGFLLLRTTITGAGFTGRVIRSARICLG